MNYRVKGESLSKFIYDNSRVTIPLTFKLMGLCLMIWTAAGCAVVGPDYQRPDTTLPTQWHAASSAGIPFQQSKAQSLSTWWRTLNDPDLTRLIELAATQNLDLKEAVSLVRQARFLSIQSRSTLLALCKQATAVEIRDQINNWSCIRLGLTPIGRSIFSAVSNAPSKLPRLILQCSWKL